MVADSKQNQTLTNTLGREGQRIRDAVAEMRRVVTDYDALQPPPDVTGSSLDGNETALRASLDVIEAEISKQCWQDQIDAYAPSHRATSFDEPPAPRLKRHR